MPSRSCHHRVSLLCGLTLATASCATAQQASRPAPPAAETRRTPSPEDASSERVLFVHSASAALKRAYDDDREDAAPLLTAWHHLNDDESLAPLRDRWREPLALGLARCRQLTQQAARLRALRRAFAKAYVDEMTGTLEGVDMRACHQAWQPLPEDGPQHLRLVVTIEPLGTHPLSIFKQACKKRRRPPPSAMPPSTQLPWSHLTAEGAPDPSQPLAPRAP